MQDLHIKSVFPIQNTAALKNRVGAFNTGLRILMSQFVLVALATPAAKNTDTGSTIQSTAYH